MTERPPSTDSLPVTPALDLVLRRLRGRLLREVWIFGVGRTLLVASLWLLFAFVIDWTLHVPSGVRLVHLAILLAVPSIVAARELVARLRKVPDEKGLAVLIERAHPELHELLVSAVEMRRGGSWSADSEIDPALVRAVIVEAEERATGLELQGVTDPRAPRTALAVGLGAVAVTALTLLLQADASRIFFARLVGGSTAWPQLTHLVVEIPLAGETHTTRDKLELSLARGSDLPIVVRAEGEIPDEVTIQFEGGHQALLGSAGRGVYRTLLRSVQEDVVFHVSGGDDVDGTPAVAITVLQPPDVVGIAVRIVPPAYSGLPERLEFDRDVQVLANSELNIHVHAEPADAEGLARLLPEDRELPLRRETFPREAVAGEPIEGLAFDLRALSSVRYRFELRDSTGLSNPDPGLFAIHVDDDRPPQVELVSPSRGEFESVLGGALLLKAQAFDDFGLGALHWSSVAASSIDNPSQGVLLGAPLGGDRALNDEEFKPREGTRSTSYAARRIEVATLFDGATPTEGESFELEVSCLDNREPTAQEGRSAPVRVRIISADEFLRRIQDRLARVRSKVEALSILLRDKQSFTHEVISSLESDEPARADSSSINAALAGARRVQGDAGALSRELASIAESLIYSRLDERASPMLEELEKRLLPIADRNFHAQPWIELAALQAEGRLGKADFADKLLEMVGVALEISENKSVEAIDGLRRAQDLRDFAATYDTLVEVAEAQSGARAELERLLMLLSEWDSYQSVLAATRDLLNRQKNLLDRTRQFYKDN